jgi:sugar/nucleoside kinase (ribokinase family)
MSGVDRYPHCVKHVVVAGHVCVDLTPMLDAPPGIEPGRLLQVGPLTVSAGGCVSNTGLALAALGIPTRLVASAGSDQLGGVLIELLASGGADASGVARVQGRGTSYSIVVDVPGRDRTFWHHIGANAAFDGGGVLDRIEAGTILHLGYATHLPALYADGGAAFLRVLSGARRAGALVSVDVAEIDPTSDAAAVDWECILARALPDIDVIKASVDDLAAMLPRRRGIGPAAWADALVELGAAVALVTAGADGLYLRTGSTARITAASPPLCDSMADWANREIEVPTLANRVVTTVGAGDTAAAGFLAGLARGYGPAESATLAAAAAATRISGRPVGETYELIKSIAPATR